MSEPASQILPTERLPKTTVREVLWIVACMLLFLAAVNLIVVFLFQATPFHGNGTYTVFQGKWNRLLKLEKPVDTLILGDSSGLHGVIPGVLDQTLGGSSINLCTWGDALLINDAWMLGAYLKKFGPPKRVVLIHVHDIWRRKPKTSLIAQVPLPWGYWQKMKPSLRFHSEELYEIFLHRYVPIISQNKTFYKLIAGNEGLMKLTDYIDESGFFAINKADVRETEEDCRQEWVDARKEKFRVSEDNVRALDAIRALAGRRGFQVYLVNAPIYEGMFTNPDFAHDYADFQAFISRYAASNKHFTQIFKEPRKYSKEEMENIDHLIASVAPDFTRRLAREIKKLESSGFTALSPAL